MKTLSLSIVFILFSISSLGAQVQHFIFTANTGDSYSIVVNAATIDGNSLVVGDEVGVFTPAGLCVGASVWTGTTPVALTAWIDDSQTSGVDGYQAGEIMSFRTWQQSSDTELIATPTYAQGNGTFGDGVFSTISLSAESAPPPGGVVVTNTNDAGPNSLREAIDKAENNAGPDTVRFAIPESDAGYDGSTGTWTIRLQSALPNILDEGLVIDGGSQAAFIGSDTNPDGPEIVLAGEQAGANNPGFFIFSAGNQIYHLVINGFSNAGVWLEGEGATGNVISACYLGTDARGLSAKPNGVGVYVQDASENMISQNLISANRTDGVAIIGETSNNNTVDGNLIGTDASGTQDLGNEWMGISIYSFSHDNKIGGSGEGEGNLISGNGNDGIRIAGVSNVVTGNIIGLDLNGTNPIGNSWDGISIYQPHNLIGGVEPGEGNIISGNGIRGVLVVADSNDVIGNYIGTNASGVEDIGNKAHGVSLTFGASNNVVGPQNTIAFNQWQGVFVNTDSSLQNTITQNSITQNQLSGILTSDGGNGGLTSPSNLAMTNGVLTGNAPPNATVEIFSDEGDEGKIYEGTVTADSAGNFSWSGTATGPNITATATDAEGNTSGFSQAVNITSVETSPGVELPERYSLSQNYPNPFNPATTISFSIAKSAKVNLTVFDLRGRKVVTLRDERMQPGEHKFTFEAGDLSSGVYFYRLSATDVDNRNHVFTRKLTLIK